MRTPIGDLLYGAASRMQSGDPDKTVYHLPQTDGIAQMTVYSVFPGIALIYHDVHATHCQLNHSSAEDILEIHHCREGRMECRYGDVSFFLAPGDLCVTHRDESDGEILFPTGHYHGVTVALDPKQAPDCLCCFLQDVNVRPSALAEKFCGTCGCFVTRSSAHVEHIFSELYSVPEEIRKGYFKVKILELLLFLSALPTQSERPGYSAAQVRLAKQAGDYLLAHAQSDATVTQLATQLGVSTSALSSAFRGVYGMTPGAFLRAQRMHGAAALLRTTQRTILDIAGQFGYDNPSKFAKAFRSVIGVAPNAYRSGAASDSCAPGANC